MTSRVTSRRRFASLDRCDINAVPGSNMANLGWSYLTREDKKKLLRGVRDGSVHGGPFHVEIHPADRCNIECFFCSTARLRGTDELGLARLESLIGEMKSAGTRAIRLSGGGEPLFHRRAAEVLRGIAASGIPIENLTTNGVLLGDAIGEILLECCDQVTVSLNTYGAASYGRMMKTPERNYERVLANVRALSSSRRLRRPSINIQFLVWKGNFADIERMYDLALESGADTILFSGLSYLSPSDRMSGTEVAAMMALYEKIIRRDEFRTIENIGSLEHDLSVPLGEIVGRVSAERGRRSLPTRVSRFLSRPESITHRIRHAVRMRRNARADARASDLDDLCVIGWHSMLIRSSGLVAPCCILQGKSLGDIAKQSLTDVWCGDAYQTFRRELRDIIVAREKWPPGAAQTAESVCGLAGSDLCTMKTFYFRRDTSFVSGLENEFERLR